MPLLIITTGEKEGTTVPIADEVLTIGREEQLSLCIEGQGVSRRHAEIFRIGDLVFLRDLGSTNGTFLNGEQVQEETLQAGDEIRIGQTVMKFRTSGKEEDTVVRLADPGETLPEAKPIEVERTPEETSDLSEGESRPLQMIKEIVQVVNRSRDPEEEIRKTVRLVAESIHADFGALLLLEPGGERLQMKTSYGIEGEQVSRSVVRRVFSTGETVMTDDAKLDERFRLSESIVLRGISSLICAPIFLQGLVSGMLYYHHRGEGREFQPKDRELVIAAAMQLSVILASREAQESVRRGMLSTIRALVTAIEVVDSGSEGHADRVAHYSVAVARRMQLSDAQVQDIRMAALLHDVGKLGAQTAHLELREEKLRPQHVFQGEQLVSRIEGFEAILPGVKYHHERADGSGYPYGLKNAETPLMARIIIVTNQFDHQLVRGGSGGEGLPMREVLKELADEGSRLYDEEVVKALLLCHRDGTLVTGVRGARAGE